MVVGNKDPNWKFRLYYLLRTNWPPFLLELSCSLALMLGRWIKVIWRPTSLPSKDPWKRRVKSWTTCVSRVRMRFTYKSMTVGACVNVMEAMSVNLPNQDISLLQSSWLGTIGNRTQNVANFQF